MERKFAYTDETDKSYGLAGMVITLNIADSEEALEYVALDGSGDGASLGISAEYTSFPVPGSTVSERWHRMIGRYQLLMQLVLGNVLCRRCVYRRETIDRSLLEDVQSVVAEEGRSYCQLEEDEINHLFGRVAGEMAQVFANPRVHDVARRYTTILSRRRRLSGAEAFELLQSLL